MAVAVIAILSALSAMGIGAAAGAFEGLSRLWILPVSFLGSFLGILLVFFALLLISCGLVDTEKPQKKDSAYYRFLCYCTCDIVVFLLRMRVHTQGISKVPRKGRFLLVCNHLNDLDPVTIYHCLKRSRLAFISKRENATMFLVGKLMHKLSCQLVNRENDRKALETIIRCIRLIQEDRASVAVFPEGYTSMDGLLHPFRSGVLKIAQRAEVPIVVCTVQNTQKVFQNARRLRPTDVEFHVLEVIPAEEVTAVTTVELGSRIHRVMAEDLGEENVLHTEEER